MDEETLMRLIISRYSYVEDWLIAHGGRSIHCLVIILPEHVRHEWHLVIHDYELRKFASTCIRADRVNESHINAVLVIAPAF